MPASENDGGQVGDYSQDELTFLRRERKRIQNRIQNEKRKRSRLMKKAAKLSIEELRMILAERESRMR